MMEAEKTPPPMNRALPHILVDSKQSQPIERERAYFICSTQNRESGGILNNSDLQTSIFSRSRIQSDGDTGVIPRYVGPANNNALGTSGVTPRTLAPLVPKRISILKEDGNLLPPCPSVSPIPFRNHLRSENSSADGSLFYNSKFNTEDQGQEQPREYPRSPPWRWLLNISGGLACIAPLGLLAIRNKLVGTIVSSVTISLAFTALVIALVKMRLKSSRDDYEELEGANSKILQPQSRNIVTIFEESETCPSDQHQESTKSCSSKPALEVDQTCTNQIVTQTKSNS